MSGYSGYSKSNNAVQAESRHCFPLTKAAKVLAKKLSWPAAKAKAFLQHVGTLEWHHTSCRYNEVKYYDVSDEHIAYITDELQTFEYKTTPKIAKLLLFKCWNFDRDHGQPRKLQWAMTKRFGNSTHSLDSVKTKLLSVKETLEREHVAGHKTHDRIFFQNIAAIEEILAALT